AAAQISQLALFQELIAAFATGKFQTGLRSGPHRMEATAHQSTLGPRATAQTRSPIAIVAARGRTVKLFERREWPQRRRDSGRRLRIKLEKSRPVVAHGAKAVSETIERDRWCAAKQFFDQPARIVRAGRDPDRRPAAEARIDFDEPDGALRCDDTLKRNQP